MEKILTQILYAIFSLTACATFLAAGNLPLSVTLFGKFVCLLDDRNTSEPFFPSFFSSLWAEIV
jgi:hypothetical protein